MTLCWQCRGWSQWGDLEFGACLTLATPAPPIDGKPASSRPTKRADSSCDAFAPDPDSGNINRRIGMVRKLGIELTPASSARS